MRMRFQFGWLMALVTLCTFTPVLAQKNAAAPQAAPTPSGQSLDRIAAIVGKDIILESDVQEEMRYARLQPYRNRKTDGTPRDQALERLIDRTLIEQQQEGYLQPEVQQAEIDKDEADMRKDIPACRRHDCTTDAGWQNFLAEYGLTEKELRARLKERIQLLRFIQQRFRNGIRISDEEIEQFYRQTMIPQYEKEHVSPPPLDRLHDRIEEVLLQQRVSELLSQWLKTLREDGSVRILKPGEEAP